MYFLETYALHIDRHTRTYLQFIQCSCLFTASCWQRIYLHIYFINIKGTKNTQNEKNEPKKE